MQMGSCLERTFHLARLLFLLKKHGGEPPIPPTHAHWISNEVGSRPATVVLSHDMDYGVVRTLYLGSKRAHIKEG